MEKSFSTDRGVIETSDEDSDALLIDESETPYRASLASSTICFPKPTASRPSADQLSPNISAIDENALIETSSESDDYESLIVHKGARRKPIIESDDDDSSCSSVEQTVQSPAGALASQENSELEESQVIGSEASRPSADQLSPNISAIDENALIETSSESDDYESLIVHKGARRKPIIESDDDDSSCSSVEQTVQSPPGALASQENSELEERSKNNDFIDSTNHDEDESLVGVYQVIGSEDKSINMSRRSVENISKDSSVVDVSDTEIISSDDEGEIRRRVIPPKRGTSLKQQKINTMLPKTNSESIESSPTVLKNLTGNASTIPPSNNPIGQKMVSQEECFQQEQKVTALKQNLYKTRNALRTLKLESLPDRGSSLMNREVMLTHELAREEATLSRMMLSVSNQQKSDTANDKLNKLSWKELQTLANQVQPAGFGGKQAMDTYQTQKTLTMDRLKSLHKSLASKPDENVQIDDPKLLKVQLMAHQKHALAFLLWREGQKPAGGILADDMGLGKTLTMIALILKTKELREEESASDDDSNDENSYDNKDSREYYPGGTLVVCPASLINQWENEISKHCQKHTLSVYIYHGSNRELRSRRLAKHDVVITTYNLVGKNKFDGIAGVKWNRIILDEAHVVRNYKTKFSIGVCELKGKKRWCLTGTPVQNKEIDLFALLKFLKCSPFDDIAIWKKWIDKKSAGGQERLNTVLQSIMLRRTKAQLQENGSITCLPDKRVELLDVKLTKEEMQIYQKMLVFSKTLFAQFLHQRAEKNSDLIYAADSRPKFLNGNPNVEYEKMHQKVLKMHGTGEVKAHQILVLLLRLRQICCHVSLIKKMIDNEACATDEIEDTSGTDIDLLEQLEKLTINDEDENETIAADANQSGEGKLNAAASRVLNIANPVFDGNKPSSKIKIIIETLKKHAIANGDKAIVVSQWTSMLEIIEYHLKQEGITCETFSGSVPVPKRTELVEKFNRQSSGLQVLLLSLSAGGVGLNLVGANHLLMVDLHWNPQLEQQAQDRIYRVGQKKSVCVYKFVTVDTIEERIKALQENKLAMANSLLTGTTRSGDNKLTMEDLKMLFDMT